MGETSNKTLAVLSALSLVVLLVGILSSSQYGIASITGFGIGNGSFSDITIPVTVLITLVINVILLIILLKNKDS